MIVLHYNSIECIINTIMSGDTFEKDYARADDIFKKLSDNLKEREKLVSANTSTAKIDYMISSELETLKFEARNLDKLAYFYINEPEKLSISAKEIKKRKDKVEAFIQKKEELEEKVCKVVKGSILRKGQKLEMENEMEDLEENKKTREEAKFLTNKDILKKAREMMNLHDDKLGVVDGIAQNMKEDGGNIGDELGLHNNLLQGLNDDLDYAQEQMSSAENRLNKLIKQTNV